MKPFRERNVKIVAVVAAVVLVAAVLVAFNFGRLFNTTDRYYADLADAGQLVKGENVEIAGVNVGTINGATLQGNHVVLSFNVKHGIPLGSTTTLQVKVLSPLGQEYIQLDRSGPGTMRPGQTIPIERTFGSPSIVGTVTQFGTEVSQINQQQLAKALTVAEQDLAGTSPSATAAAIHGLGALSKVIADRQDQLSSLVAEAQQVTATLDAHQQPLLTLIGQSTLVLQVVEARKTDIDNLLASTQSLSRQVSSILTDPKANLSALLANLQTVSGVLAKDSASLGQTIPILAGFSKYVTNATGNGPYLDAVAPTLLIADNVIKECSKPGADTDSNVLTGQGCKA
ncbi:MCE family protein [Acidiferrimicrobium sp. IK]|uniref:MCE family protein n=1 Tax=Acidiferrimicrobium sp. IK TaxID=2871700 RepID=UPI0021CB1057|nr:MCE family protein [Acidiferrimicrobium sp. IK]MCU4186138.1 MCE family protein [Acidiferrimicrobium sp. IK]